MLSNIPLVGLALALVQCLLAIPWALLLLPEPPRQFFRRGNSWATIVSIVLGVAFTITAILFFVKDRNNLQFLGKIYGSLIQAQLGVDLIVVVFIVLMSVFPKAGAVALAAFREAIRQPLFWLVVGSVLVLMILIPFLPYFTFGEDHLMARDLGLEVIMLFAVVFCALVASMSISEEIEGRTAVTLMSKPVSRRQFLLGKFFGILMAGLVLTVALGWVYCWMMDFKHYYERVHWYEVTNPTQLDPARLATIEKWVGPDEGQTVVRGMAIWAHDASEAIPGLILGFCQVMVLLALAVCLATRLPVAANVVICVVIFVLGHLTPTIRQAAQAQASSPSAGIGATMLQFVAQVFELFLPVLKLFSPTRITDVPIPAWDLALYAGEVAGYTVLYTVVLLLLGLILFEDRDLA